MHRGLAASYRKIQKVSFQGNLNRNLLIGQQFAHAFMEIDLNKKTVINVDETWLGIERLSENAMGNTWTAEFSS